MGEPSTRRKNKIKALLAGGLVLSVGAVVTFAAWNDSEFARGDFAAGAFNLEGSTNGTSFTEHPVGDPATLAFELNPTNLAPGDVVTAPFAVRLDKTTSYDATLAVTTSSNTGNLTGLTYQLIQTQTFGCGGTPVGAPLVPAGTVVSTTPAGVSVGLTQGAPDQPGAPVNLCFTVTAGDSLVQSATGSTTWEFTATSNT